MWRESEVAPWFFVNNLQETSLSLENVRIERLLRQGDICLTVHWKGSEQVFNVPIGRVDETFKYTVHIVELR